MTFKQTATLKICVVAGTILAAMSNSSALVNTAPKTPNTTIEIWKGLGIQDNDSTWTIKATFSSNKYTIDYPSLNCGGELIPLFISTDEYQFRERLLYGQSICLDNGRVTISKVDSNTALYSYFHPQGTATATLTRQ